MTADTIAQRLRNAADTLLMPDSARKHLRKIARDVEVLEHDVDALVRIMRTDLREQARVAGIQSMVQFLEERA